MRTGFMWSLALHGVLLGWTMVAWPAGEAASKRGDPVVAVVLVAPALPVAPPPPKPVRPKKAEPTRSPENRTPQPPPKPPERRTEQVKLEAPSRLLPPPPIPASPVPKPAQPPKIDPARSAHDQATPVPSPPPKPTRKAKPNPPPVQTATAGDGGRSLDKPLTLGERDALRAQVERCWHVPSFLAAHDDLTVTIRVRLSPAGELDGLPEIVETGVGEHGGLTERTRLLRAMASSARRALLRCGRFDLPPAKFEAWRTVRFVFDARGAVSGEQDRADR